MITFFKKTALATVLAATALASTTPAMARDRYDNNGGNTAAIAIGAGILGIAIGAIVASKGNDRNDRYYANNRGTYRDGYYYDRDGRRYDRDAWQRRHHNSRDDYRRGYNRDHDYQRRGY